MDSATKFCVDCVYHKPSRFFNLCTAPQVRRTSAPNLVTGQSTTISADYCSAMRDRECYCGSDAKWYVPAITKDTPWYRRWWWKLRRF